MEGLKITLLILSTVNICTCAPEFKRVIESQDPLIPLSYDNDEVTLAAKDVPTAIFLPTTDEELISEAAALVQDESLGELLRNRIGGQMSYQTEVIAEDEPQIIPLSLPKSIKTFDLKKPISEHKQAILKSGAGDPYEKLLESFIRGIMSKVLQAEIQAVRVEEKGLSKNKGIVNL